LTDILEETFHELRRRLGGEDRLVATGADRFFNFVHDPKLTLDVHRHLPRWSAALASDGWNVEQRSLRELCWQVIDASGRWDDWLEVERSGAYAITNGSVSDVLRDLPAPDPSARPGLARTLAPLLEDDAPRRLLLLTDAALLHPWFRARTLETWFHDRIRCPTVLFYPGRRSGQHGLHFLGFYPEDGKYRSTIVGGL
jgi:hypothetical protein